MSAKLDELVSLAKAAAAEAADYQERFAAEDTEARKIVDIMERFLRVKGRVVYGGAAINAHLSPARQFYDPNLYLPDYDFMTPDPLQDCADLIVAFQEEGFVDVEAKFGIHEGTYKIFVNYRSAADITFMPPDIYARVVADSATIGGIHYASVNYLRMNMYLELSRPAGMVSRWEKVYQRLLLLNEEYPLRPGRCPVDPLQPRHEENPSPLHERIVTTGVGAGAVFLSGAYYHVTPNAIPDADEVVMMITDKHEDLVSTLTRQLNLRAEKHPAMGELLPARIELRTAKKQLVAVVFEAVACHAYLTLKSPANYRLGSIDLLIQMYFAMHFADMKGILPVRLLCVIQELIELESTRRLTAAKKGVPAHEVFPLECVGHQPTLPELKRAHRTRVKEKQKELAGALQIESNFRVTRRSHQK